MASSLVFLQFEESENEGQPGLQLSDEDFQDTSVRSSKQARLLKNRNVGKGRRKVGTRVTLNPYDFIPMYMI